MSSVAQQRASLAKKMANSDGRKNLIEPFLKDTLTRVEAELFSVNPERNKRLYTYHDLLRLERKLLLDLIVLPEYIGKRDGIDMVNGMSEVHAQDIIDKYYKN